MTKMFSDCTHSLSDFIRNLPTPLWGYPKRSPAARNYANIIWSMKIVYKLHLLNNEDYYRSYSNSVEVGRSAQISNLWRTFFFFFLRKFETAPPPWPNLAFESVARLWWNVSYSNLCLRYGMCADGLMCSNCNRCQGCSFTTFMCWDDHDCIW